VTTGRNGDDGRGAFFRFLPTTPTHRYALTSDPFPASAPSKSSLAKRQSGTRFFKEEADQKLFPTETRSEDALIERLVTDMPSAATDH
jgi:hypothetical protein